MDPFFHTGLSISDSLKTVRKSVLIYETIIVTIATSLVGYFFFTIGIVVRKMLDLSNQVIRKNIWLKLICFGTGILIIGITTIVSKNNAPIYMFVSSYGNPVLFVIFAVWGIVGIVTLSIAIGENSVLELFGKNSLIILLTHFPIVKVLLLLTDRFGMKEWYIPLIIFGVIVLCEWIIIVLINTFKSYCLAKIKYAE